MGKTCLCVPNPCNSTQDFFSLHFPIIGFPEIGGSHAEEEEGEEDSDESPNDERLGKALLVAIHRTGKRPVKDSDDIHQRDGIDEQHQKAVSNV